MFLRAYTSGAALLLERDVRPGRSLAASRVLIATAHHCAPLRRSSHAQGPRGRRVARTPRSGRSSGDSPFRGFQRTKIAQQHFLQREIRLIQGILRSPHGAAIGAANASPRGR